MFVASCHDCVMVMTVSSLGSASEGGSQGLNLLILLSSGAQPLIVGGQPLLVMNHGQNCSNPTPPTSASCSSVQC